MSGKYPPEVHQFICEHVVGTSTEDLAAMTNAACGTSFTKKSMKAYMCNYKLRNGLPRCPPKGRPSKVYPAPVAEFIRNNYLGTGPLKLMEMVNETFGTSYTHRQIATYCRNHGLHSGLTGRFEKGHTPANKGKKGFAAPGIEKGWFQKGHRSWNSAPVGTIIMKDDGYFWKKIANNPGDSGHNWRQLHRIIWQEAYGPIPKGSVVIFKDGNPQNCVLENLAMVTQAENAMLNKHGLRFENPEHTETGVLIAKVKIAAAKRRKNRANAEDGGSGLQDPAAGD